MISKSRIDTNLTMKQMCQKVRYQMHRKSLIFHCDAAMIRRKKLQRYYVLWIYPGGINCRETYVFRLDCFAHLSF